MEPGVPFARVRAKRYPVETVSGVGSDAFFGNDRFLYFGRGRTSYTLMYQRTGEFTEVHKAELISLAHDVLRARPPRRLPEFRPAPARPKGRVTRRNPLTVFFGGGSLAAGPEWAFVFRTDPTRLVRTYAEYQVGTGLIRRDYFDWLRHMRAAIRARNPSVVVFMVGANDDQDFLVGGRYRTVGTPIWRRLYRGRVRGAMDVLTAGGRPVVWVGMPPMQEPDLNHAMIEVNAIVKSEAAKRPSVHWIDTWSMFSAPGGGYTDAIGGTVVRLDDGIHLNGEGSLLLSSKLVRTIARLEHVPHLKKAA